jgi:hypothetical protein
VAAPAIEVRNVDVSAAGATVTTGTLRPTRIRAKDRAAADAVDPADDPDDQGQ